MLSHRFLYDSSVRERETWTIAAHLRDDASGEEVSGGRMTYNRTEVPLWRGVYESIDCGGCAFPAEENKQERIWYADGECREYGQGDERDHSANEFIQFGADYGVFNVSGEDDFPSLQDSIRLLPNQTVIKYPQPYDTIPGKKGLLLRWEGRGAERAEVELFTSNGPRWCIDVPDSGIFQIPPDKLMQFRSGPVTLVVYRKNSKSSYASDGRPYELTAYSTAVQNLWLAP